MALKEYQLLYLDNDIPINRSFYCNNGDIKSRGLEVHVLDNSQSKDCTGLTLKMIIKVPSGELFETTVANGLVTVLNAATGIYQVLFPNNMGRGRLIAEIQLSNVVPEVIVSRKFSLVSDGSLTSDGVISELPKAGILWDVIKNEAQRQADFQEVLNNADVAVAEKFANLETEYATDLTGVKSQLAEKTLELATKATQADLVVERARISNLATLAVGSTTGDAELIDARVGADGVTRANIGESIREQFDKVYANNAIKSEMLDGNASYVEVGQFTDYIKTLDTYTNGTATKIALTGVFTTGEILLADLPDTIRVKFFEHASASALVTYVTAGGNSSWIYSLLPASFVTKYAGYCVVNVAYVKNLGTIRGLAFNLPMLDGYIEYDGTFQREKKTLEWLDLSVVKPTNVYRQISGVTTALNKQWSDYQTSIVANGYSTIEFVCKEKESYRIIGAMAGWSLPTSIYFLKADGTQISKISAQAQTPDVWLSEFTTPVGCVKVRYSQISNSNFNSQLLLQKIEGIAQKSQMIIVDANGYGDYTNIQDAIDKCGDSLTKPVTMLIYPGTYPRFSQTGKYRYISLIGLDRKNTIIKDNSGDYLTPPAELWGEGMVKNLTFIATHTDNPTLTGLTQGPSYAMHSDYGTCNYIFEDCDFVSYQQAAVGIGVADTDGDGMIFKNCRLIRKGTEGVLSNGALIAHTTEIINGQPTGIYQKFRMEDCYLEVESGTYIANINNTSANSRYDFSFKGCTLYSKAGLQSIALVDIALNAKSHGNNIASLNA